MSEAIRHYTKEFRARRDVSPYDAEVLFDAMIGETDEDVLTGLLTAWAAKGPTEDEIYRFAAILRGRMKPVDTKGLTCVDIVGTGGSAEKTFNVSTAAAFVVAGAGVAVAKHGNRAATSSSGSADVLTELGIKVDIEPAQAEENLHRYGITFMFAPKHHSLSATLAAARRRVGAPTIFNCVGPLCNPANVQHQLIGVWDPRLVPKIANVLARLGTTRSWVVNGHDRLDEISLTGHSTVAEVDANGVSTVQVYARDLGIDSFRGDLPRNCSATESAHIISNVLAGELADTDSERLVLLNASVALSIATGSELGSAMAAARESIRSGAARGKLEALRGAK